MTDRSPESDEYNYLDGYWRCGRNGGCGLPAGWGTDHNGVGGCKLHGGKSPKGDEHPNFKHGLFSDYLSEEDRDTIDALEEFDDAEKLDELINWRLARLRRAVRALSDEDERNFWDAFAEIVDSAGPVGADEIHELAAMLDRGNRAMQNEIDLVRKLIKDRNKVAEGESVQVEHSGEVDGQRTLGEDEKDMLREALDPGQ